MSNKQTSLRAARIAKRTGIWGAIGLMIFAAGLSYALRGEILWLVIAAAGFGAAFHLMGCFLFASYFKNSARDDDAG